MIRAAGGPMRIFALEISWPKYTGDRIEVRVDGNDGACLAGDARGVSGGVAAVDVVCRVARRRRLTGNHGNAKTRPPALVVTSKAAPVTEGHVDIAVGAPGSRPQIAAVRLRVAG